MRSRGRPGPSVGGVAAELAVEELDVAEGDEEAGAELAGHPSSSASQVEAPRTGGGGEGERAELVSAGSGPHAKLSVKSALQVCGGGVQGSGSSHEAAPLSARTAPAASAMAPVAKRHPKGNKCLRPGVLESDSVSAS